MAKRACLLAAALSALMCCMPALAVGQTVTATSSMNVFSPSLVTISQGETLTWNNDGGNFHNVHFEDGSFVMPVSPLDSMWSVSHTFAQPGTFKYYCEVHRDQGMSGTVVVNPPPPAGSGPGGGTPGPAGAALVSSLAAASRQHVGKLFVRASMNRPGTLTASGTVAVPGGAAKPYRFTPATKRVSPNAPVKLALKLPRKASKAVKTALRHGKKLIAKITLTARDATGNRTVRKQAISLSR